MLIVAGAAIAQAPVGPGQARKPFAKPGTPRKTERIRSYDVKHIRALLTDMSAKQASVPAGE